MKLKHKVPCKECPWRKESPQGWCGGYDPVTYADAVACNEVPACHLNDHGPDSDKTAMCVGALACAANSCIEPHKTPGGCEAKKVVGKREDVFFHPAMFYEYHSGGEKYTPFILRMMG